MNGKKVVIKEKGGTRKNQSWKGLPVHPHSFGECRLGLRGCNFRCMPGLEASFSGSALYSLISIAPYLLNTVELEKGI